MADNDKYSSLVLARLEPTRVESMKVPLKKYYNLMPAKQEPNRVEFMKVPLEKILD